VVQAAASWRLTRRVTAACRSTFVVMFKILGRDSVHGIRRSYTQTRVPHLLLCLQPQGRHQQQKACPSKKQISA
jgi:hypothetical protein